MKLFLTSTLFILFSSHLFAGVVITAPKSTISEADVKDCFLGGKSTAKPIDNSALQATFLQNVLGKKVAEYNSIWLKVSFQTGLSVPKVASSDAEVVDFVIKTEGGIGYVSTDPGASVKVLKKF